MKRPLWQQLLVIALTGGLVVALVTAALVVPLVRSVARDQSRTELARAVDTLAATPQATARQLVRERRTVGADDRTYSILLADGEVVGTAGSVLSSEQLSALRQTGSLSATARLDGEEVLVEGRQTRRRGLIAIGLQPVAGVEEATALLVRRIALALALGLLAAGAVSLLVARRIAGPVRRAADGARRLAAGERGLAVADSRITEISDMGHALATLDHALATSEGRQREFLLSISHELRTPLTAIRGYAEALRDGAIAPAEAPDVGATLTAETERLDRFIADLLELARLEADDFRVERVPVDLRALLGEAERAWQAVAARDGITLSSTAEAGVFAGDPVRVRQLLDGLLENALRVTPNGGRIQLHGSVGVQVTTIEVRDDGPGLAPGEHEQAFERGALRTAYAGQRPVGTGLGLSIARRLTERMGGEIAASPGPAGGTTITVTLGRD